MAKLKKNKPAKTEPARVYKASPDMERLMVPIGDLSPDPNNARVHPERNLAAIRESLNRWGWQKPVVVDAAGIVVAGNGTVEAARQLNWTHVPVVKTTLQGADRTGFAIADNKIAELAEWDYEKVSAQLRELVDEVAKGDLTGLAFTGWADFEIEPLLQADWSPPAPTVPVEEHERSRPGAQQVIELTETDADRIKALIPAVRAKLKLPEDASDSTVVLAAMARVAGK